MALGIRKACVFPACKVMPRAPTAPGIATAPRDRIIETRIQKRPTPNSKQVFVVLATGDADAVPGADKDMGDASPKRYTLVNAAIGLAIVSLLPVAGLVPIKDVCFAVLFTVYLLAIDRTQDKARFRGRAIGTLSETPLRTYATFMGVISVIIPVVLMLYNLRNEQVLLLLAPHVFLVMWQIWLESVSYGMRWAPVCRLAVPMGINGYRLWPIGQWIAQLQPPTAAAVYGTTTPILMALAVLNMVAWVFNLAWLLQVKVLGEWLDKDKF